MKKHRLAWAIALPAIGVWVVLFLLMGVTTVSQSEATTDVGVQVLTRGPVHEAFAEASMTGATAGITITKAPYDPITELPPDQRPEGVNVAWIPGYWSWDDDRSDFIWVSGVWRDLPPGRQWVPGYWAPVAGGSQWISGFWGDVAQTEVTYLPPPPEPLEAGPSSPSPAPGNMWTPGCWVWQQTSYAWQPGYWVVQQPDWVWSPAHYTWTPRGYVYVPGYWDHDIVHRGVMFAPVYYEQPIYTRPSYYYSPSIVIDLGVVAACLFVQPRSRHYYFGDYYDRSYEDRGYYPWYSRHVSRYGDDPLYAHYRSTQLIHDPDWDLHVDEQYRYRREHIEARPPQTLALQVNIVNVQTGGIPQNVVIGKSLTEVVQGNTSPLRFKSVNMDERKQIETRGREVHQLQSARARIETEPKASGRSRGGHETTKPVKMQLPPSPVAARPTENVEGAKTPPPAPSAPAAQVQEGRGRQERQQEVRGQMETPDKPNRAEPGAQDRRERTRVKPSETNERPERVEPRPPDPQAVETINPQKEEARPESSPQAPQSQSAPTPEARREKPEARQEKPEVKQEKPEARQEKPEARQEKPEVKQEKPEVRQEKPESKAKSRQTETQRHRGQPGTGGQTGDSENKKSGRK